MDLFARSIDISHQPLAYRMRPRTLSEYIGQEHIIGKGKLLRRAIQADQLSSIILYGPPGTGKTTLARVIANTTKSHFTTLNAVLSGVKELRYEIEEASERLSLYHKRTILFVDEVHRWNKSQQDALLPWVENGTFILIGATTENPYFEVNAALVSRSRIFQLFPLDTSDLFAIARQALEDSSRGYGQWHIEFEEGALEHVVDIANGDARSLLNAVELAVETSSEHFPPPLGSTIHISLEAAQQSIQKRVVLYDKEGDYHFDVISAFIKSIRGSDPDAALYWLAKMVHSGEDPKFIFRRLLISAAEDIGLADPHAVAVVQADSYAFERIGMPEGRFHLAHATLYLATAAKSNSIMGFFDALKSVQEEPASDVPNHLKDPSRDKEGFGHGQGYLYPHAYHEHYVAQQYLPSSLQGRLFYQPTEMGYEKTIAQTVIKRREAFLESQQTLDETHWVQRTIGEEGSLLHQLRDALFERLELERHHNVLILGSKTGFLVWEAQRRASEGYIVAQEEEPVYIEQMKAYSASFSELRRPQFIQAPIQEISAHLQQDLVFQQIIGRNIFTNIKQAKALISVVTPYLAKGGALGTIQLIPKEGSRLSSLLKESAFGSLLEQAEKHIYENKEDTRYSWDKEMLIDTIQQSGFKVDWHPISVQQQRSIGASELSRWLKRSYIPAWNSLDLAYDEPAIYEELVALLAKAPVPWTQEHLLLVAKKRE